MTVLGIPYNPLSPGVAEELRTACQKLAIAYRIVDLPTLTLRISKGLSVLDNAGPIQISHVGPSLLYWQPQAAHALAAFARLGVRTLNSVPAILSADDKAATVLALDVAGIRQLPTRVCGLDSSAILSAAEDFGYPVVIKRSHGAQGFWVRYADSAPDLLKRLEELAAEGPGAVLVQRMVVEAGGESVRVIVTGGIVRAATLRTSPPLDWRSNIARGGTQRRVELSAEEERMCLAAARLLRLGHSGVDLLRTKSGSVVLEVNSYPDFTSMIDYSDVDLAEAVVSATLAA